MGGDDDGDGWSGGVCGVVRIDCGGVMIYCGVII